MRLALGPKLSRSLHLSARILKVYADVLTGFSRVCSPDSLTDLLLPQVPLDRNRRWSMYSKDRRRGEEPSIAMAQFPVQLAVMSS